MKKRIVLIDDHTSVREMLAGLLAGERNCEVVGEAATGLQALALCAREQPDLAVLDLRLPELAGHEVLRKLSATQPRTKVLVYSGTNNSALIAETLRCRPAGFVSKSDCLATLREAMVAVMAGRVYFSSFAAGHRFSAEVSPARLSLREREVLQMVAEGRSSKEISGRLHIAPKTVENHRTHLMAKLQVRGVAALTRHAVGLGLVAAG